MCAVLPAPPSLLAPASLHRECRGGSSDSPALPAAVPGTPLAALRRPRGARGLLLARRPPRRIGPSPGAGGHAPAPRPRPLPGPRACGLVAAGGTAGADQGERGSSRSLGARSPEGGSDVRGPTEASLRPPWRGLRAETAGREDDGGLPRAACQAERTDRRPGGPDPALRPCPLLPRPLSAAVELGRRLGATLRALASPPARPGAGACGWLSRGPFDPKARSVLGTRPGFLLALARPQPVLPPTPIPFFAWAGAGVLPLPSSRPRLHLTHQGP